jgi:hypothetical protein
MAVAARFAAASVRGRRLWKFILGFAAFARSMAALGEGAFHAIIGPNGAGTSTARRRATVRCTRDILSLIEHAPRWNFCLGRSVRQKSPWAFLGRLNRQEVIGLSDLREPPLREPSLREPPLREPPLWIAAAAIVFAVAGPLFLLGLSHLT